MSWRDIVRPIIAETIHKFSYDRKRLKKELFNAYPFGERAMYPYKIWLDEIARQTGKKKPLKWEPTPGITPGWH